MEEEHLSKRDRKKQNREEGKKEEQASEKKSMMQKYGVFGAIAIAAIAFWFLVYKPSQGTSDETASPQKATVESITESDHVYGNKDSNIVLIEYGDFQCPACGTYYPIVKQLKEEYKDQIAVVFRNFPLKQLHQHAQIASQAAEAAGVQGKFWEMHDRIYETQDSWSKVRDPRSDFETFAKDLGLDVEKFKTDMNSNEIRDKVNADYASGISAQVNATPTFFINGDKLESPQGYDPFKQIIDDYISKNPQMMDEESTPSGEAMPASL